MKEKKLRRRGEQGQLDEELGKLYQKVIQVSRIQGDSLTRGQRNWAPQISTYRTFCTTPTFKFLREAQRDSTQHLF